MSFGKIKKFTEEHLKNLSLYHLGQIAWNKGRKCPEISLKLTGIKRSDETKKKIADSLIGKTGRNKGKHWKVKDTSKMNKDKIGKKRPPFSENWKKKISISTLKRKGENHPRWKKDRTQLKKRQERNDVAYQEWRLQVYKRDNFKCKILNQDCCGRIIAHHILGWSSHPELRYQLNNGITLCHAHHPRKRAEEKRLFPYFMEIVSVSKE